MLVFLYCQYFVENVKQQYENKNLYSILKEKNIIFIINFL